MKCTPLAIPEVVLVELKVFRDERGFFTERYHAKRFQDAGLPSQFVQDNHSRSAPGVLRGLHFQRNPDQGKLVSVLRGKIWDVAVDIRFGSPTFGKYVAQELDAEKHNLLWIPGGFAHGFCVLGNEEADVIYKVTELYDASKESSVLWNDPDINIRWPIPKPILSAKDKIAPSLAAYKATLQH